MPFPVKTFEQLRDRYLQAVRNEDPTAQIGPDSDNFIRACGVAAVAEDLLAHQVWVFRQQFPDLADDDTLIKSAAQRGVLRKTANLSSGTIRLFGTPTTPVAAGISVRINGVQFLTTEAGVMDVTGHIDVDGQAAVAGVAGNLTVATDATLDSPPYGVTKSTVLSMTGGSDIESPEDLLVRYLMVLKDTPQGGNQSDYEEWALQVPGVAFVRVFPIRRGPGTVDVVVMPAVGAPSSDLLAAVQAVINANKPCEIDDNGALALGPQEVAIAIAGALTLRPGYALDDVLPGINKALATLFNQVMPGDAVLKNDIVAAIRSVTGVKDVALASPAADVAVVIDATHLQRAVLGAVALG